MLDSVFDYFLGSAGLSVKEERWVIGILLVIIIALIVWKFI